MRFLLFSSLSFLVIGLSLALLIPNSITTIRFSQNRELSLTTNRRLFSLLARVTELVICARVQLNLLLERRGEKKQMRYAFEEEEPENTEETEEEELEEDDEW